MAQSIKLTDNNYIDASGVYDSTKSKTQSWLNDNFLRTDGTLLKSIGFIQRGQSAQVDTSWTTYLCISTYTNELGMWLVIPKGGVVFKINGQGSAADPTVSSGVITCNTYNLLIIRVGVS